MKQTLIILISLLLFCTPQADAQKKKVQNRPYTDLRAFHFGIHVGTHLQDLEFVNAGPVTMIDEEGVESESYISCDQDRWEPGFNVGVLGEFRLNTNFQLRLAPAIYFGNRHLTFRNFTKSNEDHVVEDHQDLKSAYIMTNVDLIFSAPRFNNHRPYLMAGLVPAINLTGKKTDFIRLNKFQTFLEVGFGCDYYLPYFKCRPELKFMYGLGNGLYTKHYEELRDKNSIAYARSVNSATTKMITLSFYFE